MVAGEEDVKNSSGVAADKLPHTADSKQQKLSEEMGGGGDANQVQLSEEVKNKLNAVGGANADDTENAKEINEKEVNQSGEEENGENGMKQTETATDSTSNGNCEADSGDNGGSQEEETVDPMLEKIKVEDESDGEIADSDNDGENPTDEQQTATAEDVEDKPMMEKMERPIEGSNNYVDIDEMDKLDFGEDEEDIPTATDQQQNAQAEEDVEKSDGEIDDSDGEVKDDEQQQTQPPGDFEEGEMFDPDAQQGPPKICRFFQRGLCTWGDSCKFIHPGVNDKGGYSLFDSPRPKPPPASRLLQPEYIYKGGPAVDPRLAPPGGFPVPPKPETAWERGLRHAKEMRRQSMQRKVHEPDFMRKREVISCNEKLNVDRDMDFIVAKSFADDAMAVDPFTAMDEDERYAVPSMEEVKRIKKFEKTNKAMDDQRSRPLISPHRRHEMHPAPQRHPADDRMRQDKRPMPSPGQHPGDRNRRSLNRHGSPFSPHRGSRRRRSRSKSRSRGSLSRLHARSPPRSLDRTYGASRNDGYGSYGAPPVRDDAYKHDRDHRSERRFERDRDHRVGQSRLLGKEPERKKDVDSRVVSIASQPDYNRTNRQRTSSTSGSGKRNDAYVDPWARTGRARRKNSRSSSESSASSRSSSSGSSSSSSRSSGSSRSSSRSSYSSGSSSSDSSRSPSPSRGGRKVAIKNKVLKKKASAGGKATKTAGGKADKLPAAQAKSAKATPPGVKAAPSATKKSAPPGVKTKTKQPVAKVKGDRGRQGGKVARPKKKSRSSSSEFSHSDSSASRSRSRSKNKGSGSDSDSGSSSGSSSSGSDSYSSSSGSDSGSDSEDDRRKSKKVAKNGARGKAGAKVSVPSKPGRKNVKMTIINKNQQAMNKASESRKRSSNQMQSSSGKSSTAAPRKVSAINNRRVQLLEQLKDVENAILRKKARLH